MRNNNLDSSKVMRRHCKKSIARIIESEVFLPSAPTLVMLCSAVGLVVLLFSYGGRAKKDVGLKPTANWLFRNSGAGGNPGFPNMAMQFFG